MAKVLRPFHCRQTNKKYYVGDEYSGDRKDLSFYLEIENKKDPIMTEKIENKKAPVTKKKTKKVTKKAVKK
jgi:hypothetical protein